MGRIVEEEDWTTKLMAYTLHTPEMLIENGYGNELVTLGRIRIIHLEQGDSIVDSVTGASVTFSTPNHYTAVRMNDE